jgi:hypothetical protein
VGYRDEQLALRLRTEAAEKKAADADRRRLAAQAEVERLQIELAFMQAAPPDVALAATKRAFFVFLGGLASFVALVGVTMAFRVVPCRHVHAPPPPMMVPLPPPLVPLEEAMRPAGMTRVTWDLVDMANDDPGMIGDGRCTLMAWISRPLGADPRLSNVLLECGAVRYSSDPALAHRAELSFAQTSDGSTRYWLDYEGAIGDDAGSQYFMSVLPERAEVLLAAPGGHSVARFRLFPWSKPSGALLDSPAPLLAFDDVWELRARIVDEGLDEGRQCRVIVSPRTESACSVVVQCGARRGSWYWDDARCDVAGGLPVHATAYPSLDLDLDAGQGVLAFERRRTHLRFRALTPAIE